MFTQEIAGSSILAVDDQPLNLTLLKTLLIPLEVDLRTTESPHEGLELARSEPPDLILLDVMMPGLDGYELCRRIRAEPPLATVPIIFLSALGSADDTLRAFEAGAVDYVTKPLQLGELVARIGTHLKLSRVQRELEAQNRQLRLAATVFETVREALLVVDARQRILTVNAAFCEVTGYRPDEVIGRNPSMLASGRHTASFYREMWQSIEQDGGWRGEIWNRRKDGTIYPEWLSIAVVEGVEGEEAARYVGVFSDISERKQLEELLRKQAHHDPLTGLANRASFHDALQEGVARARATGEGLALLYIDLDGFKPINDTLGHGRGDDVLKEVAARLRGAIRKQDVAARLGGDEFAVMLNSVSEPSHVMAQAERLLATLSMHIDTDATPLQLGASIGIALYPDHGRDAVTLTESADAAMYRAKRSGKGCCCICQD